MLRISASESTADKEGTAHPYDEPSVFIIFIWYILASYVFCGCNLKCGCNKYFGDNDNAVEARLWESCLFLLYCN